MFKFRCTNITLTIKLFSSHHRTVILLYLLLRHSPQPLINQAFQPFPHIIPSLKSPIKNFNFPYKINIFSKSPQIPAKLTLLNYSCRYSNQQKSLKTKGFSNIQSLSHRTHKLFHELAAQQ